MSDGRKMVYRKMRVLFALLMGYIFVMAVARAENVFIVLASNAAPRVEFGAERLEAAFKLVNVDAAIVRSNVANGRRIFLNEPRETAIRKEGFKLDTTGNGDVAIVSADDSGALYGCLELAKRVCEAKGLPAELHFADAPQFAMRGPCIGMQKTFILPGRKVYEYPYTPELFPFFYDKAFWQEYLDFLVENRMNTLYLWSGHPFASLVRVKDYPYAVEVSEEVFQRNAEMFRYVAQECDKRGIWLVQMFYNILLSKPFAETNGLPTQLSEPNPIAADYTRKSIAEFVRAYPNVGLMACLGEALQGTSNQLYWCTNVILPGMLDGMKEAGLTREPPLVIRTHAMDPEAIIPVAVGIYSNIFTETKFNGESLTTWEPRGKDQQTHLAMSRLSPHLVNIHILSNLEPFRYGDQQFIQKCVQAARDRLGATGLHLYPLSYWNWPDSPDIAEPPLKQWQRDWIWFTAWARYTWNPDVPADEDRKFWIAQIGEHYGNAAAEKILDAYNFSGECAPRLIRRFGITEGNRQTLSLGMTLDQLVNPEKYNVLPDLWESQSPPGERLQDYEEREWEHKPHSGETPPSIIAEVLDYSQRAVDAADAAAPLVTKNRDEFGRLQNDVRCIRAMSEFYAAKANAAMSVLRYNYSRDIDDMEKAEPEMAKSVDAYKRLTALTEKTYRFANGMQTSQRKIPVSGGKSGKPANYLWSQLLPLYEKELADFQARVTQLRKRGVVAFDESKIKPLPSAAFKIINTNAETYTVGVGAKVFTDHDFSIRNVAPELNGLTGIRVSYDATRKGRYTPVEFEASQPVQVLVGYAQSAAPQWLQVPRLETAAQADERGGVEAVIRNCATIAGMPAVDVHVFSFGAGRQKLEMIGKGSFIVLGVVPESAKIEPRDAQRGGGG